MTNFEIKSPLNLRLLEIMVDNPEHKDNFNAILDIIWREDFHDIWESDMVNYPATFKGFNRALRENKLTPVQSVLSSFHRMRKKLNAIIETHELQPV